MFAGKTKRIPTGKMCTQSVVLYKVRAVSTLRPSDHCDIKAKDSHNLFIFPENKVYQWKWK
jgi:hypothetical protein